MQLKHKLVFFKGTTEKLRANEVKNIEKLYNKVVFKSKQILPRTDCFNMDFKDVHLFIKLSTKVKKQQQNKMCRIENRFIKAVLLNDEHIHFDMSPFVKKLMFKPKCHSEKTNLSCSCSIS